ncbi:glycosyl transferase family group 2-domain-containing protein [Blyttiomyces helicus]|uniref:Glycosyl transferase family group 2-domain-containing protein n=1 Tax=Blyttiomyces helicus TaxID=388810 RepID=A0A4V1IR46_9FUNG|nr:glycosyl transferase family group 2-domain-containing protein [Blyttiomyces helicus]|eukprot:RKO88787.1 glycosyl transferase family group 2-domain-containing protein [Blyttiomyces helicus]
MSNSTPSVEEICAEPPKSAPLAPLVPVTPQRVQFLDEAYDSDGTLAEDTPRSRAGPAFEQAAPAADPVTALHRSCSFKKSGTFSVVDETRTNLGNTSFLMAILSEMWLMHLVVIIGGTFGLTFYMPQGYNDVELWNYSCWWKLGWLLPLPYTLICFFGMVLPFRTPKYLYSKEMPKRRLDNLYILTVTKGDNREAVERAWNAHKHLERLHPAVRVHVLTDEPYSFESINCYTCPKTFKTASSKYKARALEWYRQTMQYTEHDWILHLDEESVIDDESVRRVLDFIFYEHECSWGQGLILYNQHKYWHNWFFTVADAIRVGDDLSRFQLQYTYLNFPAFGAHGSFLLTNGAVENEVTWDLGSLTEDYQFAMHAWEKGFKCGKVPGIVREQSPIDLIGFMKQRRRWYVGIRRLPYALPKLWNLFWTLGILCLYCTIASVPLGFVYHLNTPRWFGILKDFSFCNFVYLYILGIFVQDVDKRLNPLVTFIHIPMTFVLQFVAGAMEAMCVMYALIFPPKDFDVIRK